MNIVLINIDALRKDKVGAYANTKNTLTPNIDELAKKGTILNQHFTVLNGSAPVQISLFTGNYPTTHGVHENGYKIPEKFKTISEYLNELKYSTCGVVSGGTVNSIYNFNKGFHYFYDNAKYDKLMFWAKGGTKLYSIRKFIRNTLFKMGFFEVFTKTHDKTNKTALRWLGTHYKEKFFLYLHYFDIHEDTYGERTKSQDKLKNYDENVKIVDSAVGEIIKKLKELGVFNNTLFIITADHGEDLNEELIKEIGKTSHGKKITEDEFCIPCILYNQGLIPIKIVNQITRVIDLLPTILELCGQDSPKDMDGISVKESIFNDKELIDAVYLEAYPIFGNIKGIRTKEWLYLLKDNEKEELYFIMEDEKLKNDLSKENEGLCMGFKFKIKNHFSVEYKPDEKDEYTKKMLKELGYTND